MARLSLPVFTSVTKSYCLLTKPGIILGNAITATGGFILASRGKFNIELFFAMLVGLSLIVASACVFNNYIDRELDQKMARTQWRPLVIQAISPQSALLFATILGVLGTLFLALSTHPLSLAVALFGFFIYVMIYSFLKYRSIHGTLIGSIAGAAPPVVGYCTASHQFDLGALIFFIMMALWQMPHFFAITLYRLEDYTAAGIPILPIKKGVHATKVQIALYIVAFIIASTLLPAFGFTGDFYLVVVLLLGLSWLWLSFQGFKGTSDKLWARKMFLFSLIVVIGLCLAIPFSV